jgi:hypothetical protein
MMPWRASLAAALERGVARGDLAADTDLGFLLDVIVGTVFQRALVLPSGKSENLSEKLATLVLGPASAST